MTFDDLDAALDRAYGDDEHTKSAMRADLVAMHDHDTTDAGAAHTLIARQMWGTLRDLGVGGGRMLVLGQDAELFAGIPLDEQRLTPGESAGFTATIPSGSGLRAGLAPHPNLRLRAWDSSTDTSRYDVVVAVPGYCDVALHRPGAATQRRVEQILGLLGCLANTEPGGYTVGLVSHDVLDDADVEGRRLLTEMGELVGAVRLPSGALRDEPGNDAVVDLLVLRRHSGTPLEPHQFLSAPLQHVRGQHLRINNYFVANPKQILGRLDVRATPWGPPGLVVHPTGQGLDQDLASRLARIVDRARKTGLTANIERSVDLDAPIEYTLAHRADLDAVRQRILHLRVHKPHTANEPPTPGPDLRRPRREDGPGHHL